MAFKRVGSRTTSQNPIEYALLTDNTNCELGQVMKFTSGRLADGDVDSDGTVQVIALKTQAAEVTSVTPVPFEYINVDTEYETTSSATVAVTLVGSKVELNADMKRVTATTTKGIFEISRTDGATTNSKVRGYFRINTPI